MDDTHGLPTKLFIGWLKIAWDAFVVLLFAILLSEPVHSPTAEVWAFLVVVLVVPGVFGTLTGLWFARRDISDLMQQPWEFKRRVRLCRWLDRTLERISARLPRSAASSRRRRRDNSSQNATLDHLPNELILAVIPHLPGADALAFRAANRRLFHLYYPHAATMDDRAELARRCRRDDFAGACQAERDGALKKGQLICAYCRATHPRGHFSAHEQARPLEKRRCLGATTAMPLCPHRALRHEQLMEARMKTGNNGMLRCERCDAEAVTYSFSSDVVLKRTYFRMEVPCYGLVPRKTLAAAIAAVRCQPVCAHLGVEQVARRFPDCWLSVLHDGKRICTGHGSSSFCSGTVYCYKLPCHARFLLARERKENGASVLALKSEQHLRFTTKTGAVHDEWMDVCIKMGALR